jgi:hypothetical protein
MQARNSQVARVAHALGAAISGDGQSSFRREILPLGGQRANSYFTAWEKLLGPIKTYFAVMICQHPESGGMAARPLRRDWRKLGATG